MTKKDKALLDYVYGQAENLVDFMKRNGYEQKDYGMVSLTVDLKTGKNEPDYIYVSYSNSKSIPSRSSYTGYHETKKVKDVDI